MILITGGIKSGKSSYALKLALNYNKRAYIATALPFDTEMQQRIEKHKLERKSLFDTFEEPIDVTKILHDIDKKYDIIVFECLTTYINNLLHYGYDVNKYTNILLEALSKLESEVIVVTNEVGWGIIPDNQLARSFIQILGSVNSKLAKQASQVYLVVSGISVKIK